MIGSHRKLLFLAAGTLALGACDSLTGSETPSLTIKLTDAPGDFQEARVKIEQIYLQGSEGRVMLMQGGSEYVDLLTLAGGKTVDLVKDAAVPAGTYSELRFVVCDAYIRTNDDKVYATAGAELPAGMQADGALQAPSFCQSGLKVKLPGGAVTLDDEARVLVVDFDVSQSFGRQAGRSGSWVMHPVVHATDFGTSGTVTGTVALASTVSLATCSSETFGSAEGQVALVSKFIPRVRSSADAALVTSGVTDASGAHKISFVAPGTYTPTFADTVAYSDGAKLVFEAAASPAEGVVVQSGKTTAGVNYTVSSAECIPAPAS